jgi:hypothetical protein
MGIFPAAKLLETLEGKSNQAPSAMIPVAKSALPR